MNSSGPYSPIRPLSFGGAAGAHDPGAARGSCHPSQLASFERLEGVAVPEPAIQAKVVSLGANLNSIHTPVREEGRRTGR